MKGIRKTLLVRVFAIAIACVGGCATISNSTAIQNQPQTKFTSQTDSASHSLSVVDTKETSYELDTTPLIPDSLNRVNWRDVSYKVILSVPSFSTQFSDKTIVRADGSWVSGDGSSTGRQHSFYSRVAEIARNQWRRQSPANAKLYEAEIAKAAQLAAQDHQAYEQSRKQIAAKEKQAESDKAIAAANLAGVEQVRNAIIEYQGRTTRFFERRRNRRVDVERTSPKSFPELYSAAYLCVPFDSMTAYEFVSSSASGSNLDLGKTDLAQTVSIHTFIVQFDVDKVVLSYAGGSVEISTEDIDNFGFIATGARLKAEAPYMLPETCNISLASEHGRQVLVLTNGDKRVDKCFVYARMLSIDDQSTLDRLLQQQVVAGQSWLSSLDDQHKNGIPVKNLDFPRWLVGTNQDVDLVFQSAYASDGVVDPATLWCALQIAADPILQDRSKMKPYRFDLDGVEARDGWGNLKYRIDPQRDDFNVRDDKLYHVSRLYPRVRELNSPVLFPMIELSEIFFSVYPPGSPTAEKLESRLLAKTQ